MPYHVGKSSECPESKPHAVIKDSDGQVMGCHSSREKAEKQIAAIHASEGDHTVDVIEIDHTSLAVSGETYEADLTAMTGTPFEAILVVEGIETGDGREFAKNALTWAETPFPLRHNIEDSHGGMPTTKTVLVGRFDDVWRNPDNPLEIRARGVFDDQGTHGAEAVRLVRGAFLRGLSIDPDDIKDADVELVFPEDDEEGGEDDGGFFDMFMMPEKTIFHAGRVRAATLVDIPAFVEAQLWLTDGTGPTGPDGAPNADHYSSYSDASWNGPVNEGRLRKTMNTQTAHDAFAHVQHGTGDAVAKTSARFLHHEIAESGDVGAANITACAAAIRTINAGRAQALTDADRLRAYEHMAQHLRAAGLTPPPYESTDVVIASAFEHLTRPPRDWFDDPNFSQLTPLTVTDDGRVFGHGAEWGTCHTSFADVCTKPPREPHGEHVYYRLGEVVTDDGSRVPVGTITLGTGHASTRGLTSSQAKEHYDNTGTAVAVVASGEDEFGIWVAGALRPDITEQRVQELRAAPLSGDWRRIGGSLRLVAFLAVNRPGFAVPRTAAFVSMRKQMSLVAAGVVTQGRRHAVIDVAAQRVVLDRIARSIGRDPATRLAELKTRVGR